MGDVLSTIMTPKVITVKADEKVEVALRLMVKLDVGSVIVMDMDRPVGIITERDVTRASLSGDQLLILPVTSLMSKPLQTAAPNDEIWHAFETMLKLGVRRLPIMKENKLIGIVTEKDLTRWVLRVFYESNIPEELRSLVQNPKRP
ncbi:MAG: cyclic nucleotide-binding/CBS domain-containing protein [Candidatus Bathyarchaeia archaeon]